MTGTLLILLALFAPLGRLAATLPNAVVAGTAVIVFAVIGVMGVNLLRRVDFDRQGNLFTLAAGLANRGPLEVGEEVSARVIKIDRADRRIGRHDICPAG